MTYFRDSTDPAYMKRHSERKLRVSNQSGFKFLAVKKIR